MHANQLTNVLCVYLLYHPVNLLSLFIIKKSYPTIKLVFQNDIMIKMHSCVNDFLRTVQAL